MPSFSHWLKGLFGNRSRRTVKRSHVRRSTVLALEALEDRAVPATLTAATVALWVMLRAIGG